MCLSSEERVDDTRFFHIEMGWMECVVNWPVETIEWEGVGLMPILPRVQSIGSWHKGPICYSICLRN